ncbi:diadenosine tetraphosphate (Ap4A) HIT family hydrolase [Branchiibius hedensis]|uniref:Diadenosine tetraphosphate (Ap4A) hydrolase n=1 Tax=Branchiibius hedensis TaxID=672460 RepID=A0A2Y8ZPY9_9MICO|nr:HIT family protein [Branchiibius hedensis]PWJ25180.1 diadenosine tetraphosphate (Ap4A) HIT family hydrolase [Branchiibius hedensis]SSA33995.1 Diadenosine tetraphosphate (Ap4A) hydrolase [Branchiibius hedensis]
MDTASCYPCRHEALESLPPRENVVSTAHWRAAHAFNSTLPGWLVLVPRTHVMSFADLPAAAADELGGLIRGLSVALREVTGCVKTYVMQFAEAEGFGHLHIHLVPRAADLPDELKGPRVFGYLTDDTSRWLPDEALDEIAAQVTSAWEQIAGLSSRR